MRTFAFLFLLAKFGSSVGGLENVEDLLGVSLGSLETSNDVSAFFTRLESQLSLRHAELEGLPSSRRLELAALRREFTSELLVSKVAKVEHDSKVKEVELRHEVDLLVGKKLSTLAHLFLLHLKVHAHVEDLAKRLKVARLALGEMNRNFSGSTVKVFLEALEEQISFYSRSDLLGNPEHPGVAHVNYLKGLVEKAKAKLEKEEGLVLEQVKEEKLLSLEHRDAKAELARLQHALLHNATPEEEEEMVHLMNRFKPVGEPLVFHFNLPESHLLVDVEKFVGLAHEAKLAEEEAKKSALSLELDAALGRLEELKLRLDGFVIDKTKLEVLDLLRWLESNPDFKLLDKWPGSEYLENLHALVHRADHERLLKEKELAVARDHREALGRELDGMKARLEVLRGRLNGENLTEKTKNEVLGLLAKVRGNPEFRNTPQWPGPGYLNGFEALLAKAEEEKAAHLERLRATKERRDAVGVDLASHNVFTLELQHHLEGYLDADLTVDRANLNLDAVSLDD